MMVQLQEITDCSETFIKTLVCLFVYSSDVYVATASTIDRAIGMG